jgi:predicted Zn-dependent protease with MMP-like domain
VILSNNQFDKLINQALEELPGEHVRRIKNVAILAQDDPDDEQRIRLKLRKDQTLLGLYEGVPLSRRQGLDTVLPDKITLFKNPLIAHSHDFKSLKEQIKHTLWHEIAHYYGLDHDKIRELE